MAPSLADWLAEDHRAWFLLAALEAKQSLVSPAGLPAGSRIMGSAEAPPQRLIADLTET